MSLEERGRGDLSPAPATFDIRVTSHVEIVHQEGDFPRHGIVASPLQRLCSTGAVRKLTTARLSFTAERAWTM